MDDFPTPPQQNYTFKDALNALKVLEQDAVVLPPAIFYGLSDLTDQNVDAFKKMWLKLSNEIRSQVARRLVETSELNFEFNYQNLAISLLSDSFAPVRQCAVELLWDDETVTGMDHLVNTLKTEPDPIVRAEILSALGRYIRLGEYDDIPAAAAKRAQSIVVTIWHNPNESRIARRRALEAIGNSSRDDLRAIIHEGYQDKGVDMRQSAVYAMGRSCDKYWVPIIMEELNNDDPELRYEAVRASGEVEIEEALPHLYKMASQNEDRELQEIAIWAMGEIGGDDAVHLLNTLAEAVDASSDILDSIEDAISLAEMRINLNDFDIDL